MFHFFPKTQTDPFAPPAFQIDATVREDYESSTQWTKVPIEAQATIADFHYVQPDIYRVEGMLSPIMPFAAPRGVDGVKDQIGELVRLLKAGTVLTCVFGFDTVDIALSKAARSLSHGDGFALRVRLEFIEIRQITTQVVDIPASRLKRSVRRQGAKRATFRSDQARDPDLLTSDDIKKTTHEVVKGPFQRVGPKQLLAAPVRL